MFIVGNLVGVIAEATDLFFKIYTLLIIVRILISWVSPDPFNPFVVFLQRVTEPVLAPFRRLIPLVGPFDVSPIVAIFVLQLLQRFLVQTLLDLSVRLR